MINTDQHGDYFSCAVNIIKDLPDTGKASFKNTLMDNIRNSDIIVDAWPENKRVIDPEEIPAFYLMAQALRNGNGWVTRFAKWIEAEGLGTVTVSRTKTNPNTGNKVTIFIWEVNRPAFIRWIKANCLEN